VSENFDVVALGGAGEVTLWDVHTGILIREIALEGAVPHKVAITDGFGFVVVAVTESVERQKRRFLVVFTINGMFVRKREIADEVALWYHWTSAKGTDFVVFTTDSETVSFTACEVWALNFAVFKCKGSNSPIVSLTYLVQKSLFVVSQAEGRINVFCERCEEMEAPVPAEALALEGSPEES
jgi:hypothetical protein